MSNQIRLGISGLGTVGAGVVQIVQKNAHLLAARCGRSIEITAVSARSRTKDRGVDLSGYAWEENPIALAQRDDVDIYLELIGGEDGLAKHSVMAALAAGKHVVTANKAMLAMHGLELACMAEDAGRALRYEAAVAGGIPVIKSLTEGLAGNEITRVMGVMNGSCNYILTRMEDAGLSYEEVFAEANALGYLEADPQLDVGGIDAAHKLAILSAIAFGARPDFAGIELQGIEQISSTDIQAAAEIGYKIKLLGVAQKTNNGLEQRMMPCLVPASSPLGQLQGGTNMVVLEGDFVGPIVLRGPGAGAGPTASAVIADVCDIARGAQGPVFGQAAQNLAHYPPLSGAEAAPYYLRLTLLNRPDALAQVTAILSEQSISIDQMRQQKHSGATTITMLIITYETTASQLMGAVQAINLIDVLHCAPVALRIENPRVGGSIPPPDTIY